MFLNTKMLKKTIESGDLDLGGQLDPQRQDQFAVMIRELSAMLSKVRFVTLDRLRGSIDRLHIGEPITVSASENAPPVRMAEPKFDRIAIQAEKLRTDWQITRETLLENIERDDFEDTIMAAITRRMSTDLEMLAIQGNPATYATQNDAEGHLLRNNQGWDVQTADVHLVDAAGSEIAREMFAAGLRSMPQDKKNDPALRWLINPDTLIDYVDLYGGRGTPGGDRANVEGIIERLMGRPVMTVPLIPNQQMLVVSDATAASVYGRGFDPYKIEAGINDQLLLAFDAGVAVGIILTEGLRRSEWIAREINVAIGAEVAYEDGYGRLIIQSTTTGATSQIDVLPVADSAYDTLGLVEGTYNGADAGSSGEVPEGTFIWLANPMNFIWVMVLTTSVFDEFNKDYDRWEFTVFSFHDFIIEDKNALSKVVDVRRRQLV